MNIFIIPSWYPSPNSPSTGRFFKEQAELYAKQYPNDQLAIAHWGQNDSRLLLSMNEAVTWPLKVWKGSKLKPEKKQLLPNCQEFYTPAFTWTRRFLDGNIKRIIALCAESLKAFEEENGKVDLIHAHVAFPGGFIARELSRMRGIPYVIMEHMGPFPMVGLAWKKEKYCFEPLRSAGQVISVSKRLQNDLLSEEIESLVLPNYIEDNFFSPSKKELIGSFRFLIVARLEEGKGHMPLLEACADLKDVVFTLTMVGKGSLGSKISSRIRELDLQNKVFLVGEKSRLEVRNEIRSNNAFIFPSTQESFGIAPLEALACGVPIIAPDVGEVGNMITEETGIKLKDTDRDSICNAIGSMLKNRHIYKKERIRAFYDRNYSSIKTVKTLRSIYTDVLSGK